MKDTILKLITAFIARFLRKQTVEAALGALNKAITQLDAVEAAESKKAENAKLVAENAQLKADKATLEAERAARVRERLNAVVA
jgi:cell division protein FtsB